jgi:hypothetical protein
MSTSNATELRALTLWRPWDEPVACGAKPIENRPWPPPRKMVGERIAIHAGKVYDDDAAAFIRERGYELRPRAESDSVRAGAIVGVARIVGYATMQEGRPLFGEDAERWERIVTSTWFFGPYGWLLEDAVAITPVPCRGAQGLWPVESRVADEVLRRVANGGSSIRVMTLAELVAESESEGKGHG